MWTGVCRVDSLASADHSSTNGSNHDSSCFIHLLRNARETTRKAMFLFFLEVRVGLCPLGRKPGTDDTVSVVIGGDGW